MGIFLFFVGNQLQAQIKIEDEIVDLYNKDKELVTSSNSMHIAFTLLKKATQANDNDKIIYALYSLSQSYFDTGMYNKALYYSSKAIENTGSDKHLSRLYALRVRSFCYLDLSMLKKSFDANAQALAETEKILEKNTDEYHLIKGLLYRDKSVYYDHPDSILKYDKKNLEEFLKLKNKHEIAGSTSMPYNNVGYDYLVKKNFDSAWHYYKKAEDHVIKENDEYNLSFVYQSFGEYYEATNKTDSALIYFKKSLVLAEKYRDYKLAQAVTDYIRGIYLKRGDTKNSVKYDELYSTLTDSINSQKSKEINTVITSIEKDKDVAIENSNRSKIWIAVSLSLLLFCVIGYTLKQYYKNKKDYLKFTAIISDLESKKIADSEILKNEADQPEKTISSLSDQKENELMKKLNNFEKKEQFLSSDISLSSLASSFNTNVNYLSKVIKKYKNNNFNGYINDLRINYITNKLRSNPEYLNYKIAYLAEECGFSSYSSFVSIFKQQTGLTPSKFIEYLNKE